MVDSSKSTGLYPAHKNAVQALENATTEMSLFNGRRSDSGALDVCRTGMKTLQTPYKLKKKHMTCALPLRDLKEPAILVRFFRVGHRAKSLDSLDASQANDQADVFSSDYTLESSVKL